MRIFAHWESCSPALITRHPRVCYDGVRRPTLTQCHNVEGCEDLFRQTGHQHLVLKGMIPTYVRDEAGPGAS